MKWVAAAYLRDVDNLSGFWSDTNYTNGRVNGADRCTHASDQYDTPPSIGNHNLGSFTSGEIGPVNVNVKELLSAVEGISVRG